MRSLIAGLFRRRPRYILAIQGYHSGHVTVIPFMTFTHEREARRWASDANARHHYGFTRWVVLRDDVTPGKS